MSFTASRKAGLHRLICFRGTVAVYMKHFSGMLPIRVTWPHEGPHDVAKGTPRLSKASVSLAPDICNAHEAVLRVLSIEVSMGGIAHLRNLMNEAPVDVAHPLKDVWKELLLRGVWNPPRCDW